VLPFAPLGTRILLPPCLGWGFSSAAPSARPNHDNPAGAGAADGPAAPQQQVPLVIGILDAESISSNPMPQVAERPATRRYTAPGRQQKQEEAWSPRPRRGQPSANANPPISPGRVRTGARRSTNSDDKIRRISTPQAGSGPRADQVRATPSPTRRARSMAGHRQGAGGSDADPNRSIANLFPPGREHH